MNNSNQNPNVLYRFFDKDKNLLYIGISKSFGNRFNQHAHISEWFAKANSVTIEHYPNRASVETAEKKAIKSERPKYNKSHNPDYESAVKHYRILKSHFFRKGKVPDSDHHELMILTEKNWKYFDYNPNASTFTKALLMAFEEWLEMEGGGLECSLCHEINTNRQWRRLLSKKQSNELRRNYGGNK